MVYLIDKAMKNKNISIRTKEYDAIFLQHLDEVLQEEEQAHAEYLD